MGWVGTAFLLAGQGLLALKAYPYGWGMLCVGALFWLLRGASVKATDIIVTNAIFLVLGVYGLITFL